MVDFTVDTIHIDHSCSLCGENKRLFSAIEQWCCCSKYKSHL